MSALEQPVEAEPVTKICSEVRISNGGRIWMCVLPLHDDDKHYMISDGQIS